MEAEVLLRIAGVAGLAGAIILCGVGLTTSNPRLNWINGAKWLACYGLVTLIWGGINAHGYLKMGGLMYLVGGLVVLNLAIDKKNKSRGLMGLSLMIGGAIFMFSSVVF